MLLTVQYAINCRLLYSVQGTCTYIFGLWLILFPYLMRFIFILLQIDRSIVESFGGQGRTCITARVYPMLAVDMQAHLYAFNNGTLNVKISNLSAWSMKNAQIASAKKRRKSQV